MNQSTGPPAPSATQSSGQREMMFCHRCYDEWYRDEQGIICPQCDSEFTEIIEEENDPRYHSMLDRNPDDDDDSEHSSDSAPANLHDHILGHTEDPDEADISTMRWRNVGPGRFHVSATIHRTISPAQLGPNGNGPNTLGAFSTFLANLIQGARPPDQQNNGAGEGPDDAGSRPRADGGMPVHRFLYHAGARIRPADANNPHPRLVEPVPVDDMNNVLAGLLAALGEPPGGRAGGSGHNHTGDDLPMNPLMGLFAAMSGGQHGDFVYSQEALDRIISQLMEQTASSNAPGPASAEDISSLPRKKITVEMLGAEGRADCSICMEEVNIGEEVTELPCTHWFHHQCVAAWLTEHDTCPHCRKGISIHKDNSGNATSSETTSTPSMPSASGVAGQGTVQNPFVMSRTIQPPGTAGSNAGANEEASGSSGGFNERLRRGWFGPQQND